MATTLPEPRASHSATFESTTPMLSLPRQKFELLQVYRGITALSVVLFHLTVRMYQELNVPFVGVFLPAQSGVDFFFVLSGFIIYYSHRKDLGQVDRVGRYAKRRFLRIYPLYLLTTLGVLALYIFGFGNAYKNDPAVIIKSLLLFPQQPGMYPIANVGWTLCHEALFYGLFGIAICLHRRFAVPLIALLLGFTLVNLVAPIPGPYWISRWLFSPYNLEFAAGCAAAHFAARRFSWMMPAGFLLLTATWSYCVWNDTKMGSDVAAKMILLFGLPYAMIVMGSASWEVGRSPNPPRSLSFIGDATYSIYLSHFVVLSALVGLVGSWGWVSPSSMVFIFVVTTIFGCLVHLWIEAPILKRMRFL